LRMQRFSPCPTPKTLRVLARFLPETPGEAK